MSSTLGNLQSITLAPLVLAALVAAAALLVGTDPLLGRRQHRAFLAELAAHPADPAAAGEVQVRFYRLWVRAGWLAAGGTLALVLALPGVGPANLGLRWPELAETGAPRSFVTGLIAGLVGALVAAVVAAVVAARAPGWLRERLPRRPARIVGSQAVLPMLPTTPHARRGWVGLAVTAGLTEEVTYRGLVVLVLALVLPGAHPVLITLIAGILFGAAHWYQGAAGMVATAVVGCAFAAIYLATGSLLIPIGLHILFDLRPLLMRTTTPPEPAAGTRPAALPAAGSA